MTAPVLDSGWGSMLRLAVVLAVLPAGRPDTSRPLYLAGDPGTEDMIDIHVGMMLPFNSSALLNQFGFPTSAGSQVLALDRIREEKLLKNVNWTFTYYFPDCNEYLAAGIAIKLIEIDRIDILIGPPCSLAAVVAGPIAKYYNVPLISWGATLPALSDRDRFPTFARTVPSADAVGKGVLIALRRYHWNRLALLYNNDGKQQECVNFATGLRQQIASSNDITLSFEQELADSDLTIDNFDAFFEHIESNARILVVCIDNMIAKRELLIRATEKLGGSNYLGLDNYLFLLPDFLPATSRDRDLRFWFSGDYLATDPVDAQDDEKAFQALLHSALVHVYRQTDSNFIANVVNAVERWPFEYKLNEEEQKYYASTFSPYMHDALYLYALALNKTLEEGHSPYSNGLIIINNTKKVTPFNGASGVVALNEYFTRQPTLCMRRALSNRMTDGMVLTALLLTYEDEIEKQFNATYTQAMIWKSYANQSPPPAEPPCGFDGQKCITTNTTLVVLLSMLGLGVVIAISFAVALAMYRNVEQQRQKLRAMWWISPIDLKSSGESTHDAISRLTLSSSTKNSAHISIHSGSRNSDISASAHPGHNQDRPASLLAPPPTLLVNNSGRECCSRETTVYHGQTVLVVRFDRAYVLTNADEQELQQMRQLSHNNVNPFVGLCIGDNGMRAIFNDCPKGCLLMVLTDTTKIDIDWMFKFSLIHDLVEGLNYLSESPIGCHGYLTPHACLIDSRWMLRISDYGLKRIRSKEVTKPEFLMWTPPELLRDETLTRNIKTDVYSLGIIISEIISRQKAYSENNASVEEILYRVRQNESRIYRPELRPEHTKLVPKAIVSLMNNCWAYDSESRPGMISIRTQLDMMLEDGSSPALVDHVLRMVEQKAAELNKKTKELTDEKKKTEALLYRLLPAQVADKMKIGQRVDPEQYDSVTIFFSDVVSFTTLASKCTPLQVVDLLNNLYTRFDALIEMFDIYKVETIGDGYLCVSGLPHRNGIRHAGQIADLSLKLLESIAVMKIPHLPDERIRLRIGMHSDAVVAAVVGLAMPRYCLFGDAVNTASPDKIQLTESTKTLLKKLGGYKTEVRGETMIKGKGLMVTYWLTGKTGKKNPIQFSDDDSLTYNAEEKSYTVNKVDIDE